MTDIITWHILHLRWFFRTFESESPREANLSSLKQQRGNRINSDWPAKSEKRVLTLPMLKENILGAQINVFWGQKILEQGMGRIYQEFLPKKKPAGMNYGASTILTLGLKFVPNKKHQNGRFRGNLIQTSSPMILQILWYF